MLLMTFGGTEPVAPIYLNKRILVSGDSTITFAACRPDTIASKLFTPSEILDGFEATNIAVGGHTIAQQKTVYLSLPDKTIFDIIIVQIGLNDLLNTIEVGVADYQDYINTINSTKRADARVFISACLPCKQRLIDLGYYPASQVFWEKLNESIMGGGSMPIIGIAKRNNYHVALLDDGFGSLKSIYNCGDNVHENQAGADIIIAGFRGMIFDTIPVSIPAAPVLSYSSLAETTLTLTATIVAGATNYKFYQGATLIATQPSNVLNVTGLTGSTAYNYKVKASNISGDSVDSNVVSVTTAAGITVTPLTIWKQPGTSASTPSSGVFQFTENTYAIVCSQTLIGDGLIRIVGKPNVPIFFGLDVNDTRTNVNNPSAWKLAIVLYSSNQISVDWLGKNATATGYNDTAGNPNHPNLIIKRVGTEVSLWGSADNTTYAKWYTIPISISGTLNIKMQSASGSTTTTGVITVEQ